MSVTATPPDDHGQAEGELVGREAPERVANSVEATTAIAQALGGETDLDVVLDLIVDRGRELVDAEWASILILDGDELELRATAGSLTLRPIGYRYPLDGTLAGRTLRSGAQRTVMDLSRQAYEADRAFIESLGAEHALVVPLEFRGRAVGVLIVAAKSAAFSGEQEQLLNGFAASAATAIATAQSVAADQLRQSVASAERERRRWARELHDETLQELGAAKVMLDRALRRKKRPEELETLLGDVQRTVASSIEGLHRMIGELRPAALDELGVEAAVRALAERRRSENLDIEVAVDLDWECGRQPTRLAPEVESTVHRLVQEALANVSKHAQASRAEVTIVERDGQVILDVFDNGRGLGTSDTQGTGLGLIGMRERVALLGGKLDIGSPGGGGTHVHATLPALHASAREIGEGDQSIRS